MYLLCLLLMFLCFMKRVMKHTWHMRELTHVLARTLMHTHAHSHGRMRTHPHAHAAQTQVLRVLLDVHGKTRAHATQMQVLRVLLDEHGKTHAYGTQSKIQQTTCACMLRCVQKLLDYVDGKTEIQLDTSGALLSHPAPASAVPDPGEPALKKARLQGQAQSQGSMHPTLCCAHT